MKIHSPCALRAQDVHVCSDLSWWPSVVSQDTFWPGPLCVWASSIKKLDLAPNSSRNWLKKLGPNRNFYFRPSLTVGSSDKLSSSSTWTRTSDSESLWHLVGFELKLMKRRVGLGAWRRLQLSLIVISQEILNSYLMHVDTTIAVRILISNRRGVQDYEHLHRYFAKHPI